MAFGRDADTTRGIGSERTSPEKTAATLRSDAFAAALAADPGSSWAEPEKEPRDWKKLALVIGLGILSWVATYVGMLELIEANMGDLPILHKVVIGFSVAMLMTMVVWLLDQLFAPNPFVTKLMYGIGYVFLTLISVGFGFGFYWKVLESRSESSRSAESAVTQVQSSLHAASTRLDQLSTTLVQLTGVSSTQAGIENAKGTSCPNSKPGDGPRRKLRDDDAARFNFASEFVKGRAGQVKTELGALDADLVKIAANDASLIDAKSGTRNEFMKALGRKLDLTVTGFNAFRTDPQLRQIRTDLAERAEKTTFADSKGGTFSCPDTQLQTALRGVVRAIDQLPDLEKPKIAAVEGSEATIEAFRRLTATFYGALSFKLPPSADELRDLQKKAVQSVETPSAGARAILTEAGGLSKRDYIPLAIAAFVDLCLLLVSMGRPANRLGGLVGKMREAEKGPVIQILSRFNDIHRDPAVRQNFEVFRHVVFDFNGAYYVAVPLDAPYRFKKAHGSHGIGTAQLEELQQEAHLLANLFASFEKEKIFSRVYTPLLSTKAIQKKLWRQGSKFAGCEAFRIYRFRDGAWSELILGAVMGAARRVEVSKRHRRIEDEITRTFGPAPSHAPAPAPAQARGFAPPYPTMGPTIGPAMGHAAPAAGPAQGYRRPAPLAQGHAQGHATQPPSWNPANPGYPGHADVPRHHAPAAFHPQSVQPAAAHPRHADTERWGPYAAYAPPAAVRPAAEPARGAVEPGATAIRTAANGNTAPAAAGGARPVAADEPVSARAAVSAGVFHAAGSANSSLAAGSANSSLAAGSAAVLPANVTPLPHVMVRPQGVIAPAAEMAQPAVAAATAAAPAPMPRDDTHIVLSRTETISIPATAASLPAALVRSGFGGALRAATAAAKDEIIATPAIAPTAPEVAQATAERSPPLLLEAVSDDDIKTLRRFAPGAAE